MGRRERGFNLVELLVLSAGVSILAAVLVPLVARSRARASSVACRANLRGIGVAFGMYQADYDEFFPSFQNCTWTSCPNGRQCLWTANGGIEGVDTHPTRF